MMVYVDTSALVKKYVREAESDQVVAFLAGFEVVGASVLTQVEMAGAMSKAVRQGWVEEATMQVAWQDFLNHWTAYTRLPVSSGVINRAAGLAWQHGLRAYDALQLASALIWQEMAQISAGETTYFACFDIRLSKAAQLEGLMTWPDTTE